MKEESKISIHSGKSNGPSLSGVKVEKQSHTNVDPRVEDLDDGLGCLLDTWELGYSYL